MTNVDVVHRGPQAALIRLSAAGKWVAAMTGCVVVVACLALLGAGKARADTIEGAITSITTTATSTAQWDRVDLACTWAVPDGSSPGDTFTLQLPPELRWFGSTDFDLKGPDGQPVAHAHANPDGSVVFTLTDYVLTHPVGVHGSCHFSTQYIAETTDETVHLDFQVGDEVIRVDVGTVGSCTENCAVDRTEASKVMYWADAEQSVTQSVIRAPATASDVSDVTITDAPGPGLALDCATVAATIGKVLDAHGDVTAPRDDARYVPVIACTTQSLTVTWSDVPAGEYTEVRVKAHVTDPRSGDLQQPGRRDRRRCEHAGARPGPDQRRGWRRRGNAVPDLDDDLAHVDDHVTDLDHDLARPPRRRPRRPPGRARRRRR